MAEMLSTVEKYCRKRQCRYACNFFSLKFLLTHSCKIKLCAPGFLKYMYNQGFIQE